MPKLLKLSSFALISVIRGATRERIDRRPADGFIRRFQRNAKVHLGVFFRRREAYSRSSATKTRERAISMKLIRTPLDPIRAAGRTGRIRRPRGLGLHDGLCDFGGGSDSATVKRMKWRQGPLIGPLPTSLPADFAL